MVVGNVLSIPARQTHVSAVEVVRLTVWEVGHHGLIALRHVVAVSNRKLSRSLPPHQVEEWPVPQPTMNWLHNTAQLLPVRSTASGIGELGPTVPRRVEAERGHGHLEN